MARRHVTLSEQQDGQVRLSGSLDTETASLLREAIDPLCAPAGAHDDRPPPVSAGRTHSARSAGWRCAPVTYRTAAGTGRNWW